MGLYKIGNSFCCFQKQRNQIKYSGTAGEQATVGFALDPVLIWDVIHAEQNPFTM